MIEKIQALYEKLNVEYISGFFYPDDIMRDQIKYDIEKKMDVTVKCDEENNPPDVAYSGCIIAQVSWKEYPTAPGFKYKILIFGNPWDIESIKA